MRISNEISTSTYVRNTNTYMSYSIARRMIKHYRIRLFLAHDTHPLQDIVAVGLTLTLTLILWHVTHSLALGLEKVEPLYHIYICSRAMKQPCA